MHDFNCDSGGARVRTSWASVGVKLNETRETAEVDCAHDFFVIALANGLLWMVDTVCSLISSRNSFPVVITTSM